MCSRSCESSRISVRGVWLLRYLLYEVILRDVSDGLGESSDHLAVGRERNGFLEWAMHLIFPSYTGIGLLATLDSRERVLCRPVRGSFPKPGVADAQLSIATHGSLRARKWLWVTMVSSCSPEEKEGGGME
jgi:hypothetical protein